MSRVLGICDGHDSGACIVDRGRLVAAVSSERLSGRKRQPGFPGQAIAWCLQHTGGDGRGVEQVAVAEIAGRGVHRLLDRHYRRTDPNLPMQRRSNMASMIWQNLVARGRCGPSAEAGLSRRVLGRRLGRMGITAPLRLVDHHLCHALGAARASGFDEALVVTMDAFGDGCSGGVWLWQGGRLKGQQRILFPHSPALIYGLVTSHLGFSEGDEGKVSGLAARGDPGPTAEKLARLFSVSGEGWRLRRFPTARWLCRALAGRRPEDIAAGVQRCTEDLLCPAMARWMRHSSARRLCLSGGLFANVRLNQQVARAADCEDFFVFPHMGDGGLCVGAAWTAAGGPQKKGQGASMLLGPQPRGRASFGQDLRTRPLNRHTLGALARSLARGHAVGVVRGPMEFGPRALGNRSILFRADRPDLARRLGEALGRPAVMPFAPVMRQQDLAAFSGDRRFSALDHMTVTITARPGVAEQHPVAVHADGSMRAQVVDPEHAPLLHRLLTCCEEHCEGPPLLINTSFNAHTEPIINSNQRALELFQRLPLHALVLGDEVLTRRQNHEESVP